MMTVWRAAGEKFFEEIIQKYPPAPCFGKIISKSIVGILEICNMTFYNKIWQISDERVRLHTPVAGFRSPIKITLI